MPGDEKISDHEWRLDVESGGVGKSQSAEVGGPQVAPRRSLSHARLVRPVYVVTVEHLGWLAIGMWAVLTRALVLGAAPLSPAAASAATLEFAISKTGRAALDTMPAYHAAWPELLQAAVFHAVGASDASARVIVAACGVVLIAIAFAMRPYIGRAGALSLAAMLAISPSMTYFSRTGATAFASVTFMLAAIAVAESMRSRPGLIRGVVLGCAIAMWVSADSAGYASAAAVVVALACIGAFNLVTHDHRRLRIRVWWERRRSIAITATGVAIAGFVVLTTTWFGYRLADVVAANFLTAFAPPRIAFARGLRVFLPILGFYEFTIAALAFVGAVAIVADKERSRFAVWSMTWAIVSAATLLTVGANRAEDVLALLIPFAILAAFGVEGLHRSERWPSIRYGIAAFAALTIWVQLTTNFICRAPNTNEAAWNRHALLYWQTPTTSLQTRKEFSRAAGSVTANGMTASILRAYIPDDAPQARWYLRDFAAANAPDAAAIVVTIVGTQTGSAPRNPEPGAFGFEEWWNPDYRLLTIGSAIRYLITQRVWSDVQIRDAKIEVRAQSAPAAGE